MVGHWFIKQIHERYHFSSFSSLSLSLCDGEFVEQIVYYIFITSDTVIGVYDPFLGVNDFLLLCLCAHWLSTGEQNTLIVLSKMRQSFARSFDIDAYRKIENTCEKKMKYLYMYIHNAIRTILVFFSERATVLKQKRAKTTTTTK